MPYPLSRKAPLKIQLGRKDLRQAIRQISGEQTVQDAFRSLPFGSDQPVGCTIGQKVDVGCLSMAPIGGNLQHGGAGKTLVGEQGRFSNVCPLQAILVSVATPERSRNSASSPLNENGTSAERGSTAFRPNWRARS